MAQQPLLHLGVLVSSVIVGDQMDLLVRWRDIVDHTEELQPLLMTMPVVAHADYRAVKRV